MVSTGSRLQALRNRLFIPLSYYDRERSVGTPGTIHASLLGFGHLPASPIRGTAGGNVSPILLRPVREQQEHDHVIRLLQTRLRRRFQIAVNLGEEANQCTLGARKLYPDLMLMTDGRAKVLRKIVEVETNESINHLEAMAEWLPYGRVRAIFHLYVPSGCSEKTQQLCKEKKIQVDEIWSYHAVGDNMRFTLAYRAPENPGKLARIEQARKTALAKQRAKPKVKAKSAESKKAVKLKKKRKASQGKRSTGALKK